MPLCCNQAHNHRFGDGYSMDIGTKMPLRAAAATSIRPLNRGGQRTFRRAVEGAGSTYSMRVTGEPRKSPRGLGRAYGGELDDHGCPPRFC